MPLVTVVITLIIVGVLLWVVNAYGKDYIAAPILKLINAVVVIACILWLLTLFFGPLGGVAFPRVGR
jgi:hypothetical protein